MNTDHLGDPLPEGYRPWSCNTCGAVCNFEAMNLCSLARRLEPDAPCGFDEERPESNGGCFGFIMSNTESEKERFCEDELRRVYDEVLDQSRVKLRKALQRLLDAQVAGPDRDKFAAQKKAREVLDETTDAAIQARCIAREQGDGEY